MPNWKTYESSVRLLSAIVAAHPGLKLNYDEVARFLGDGTKYKSVWDRMNVIKENAKVLTAAVNAGKDPSTVELPDTSKVKAQEIAAKFGGDCTMWAVQNRFRQIKSDAKLINDALRRGVDPVTLAIGKDDRDIAKCYGTEVTKSAIVHVFARNINPNAKNIRNILQSGGDPRDVPMNSLYGKGNGQIISTSP